jgi:Glycosyl hydrolases family 6
MRGRIGAIGLCVLAAGIAVQSASGERAHAANAVRLGAGDRAHGGARLPCATPDVPAPRDPSNPLALPMPPAFGQSPLAGAHFFVDGPRHGQAAGAIAGSLGLNPMTFPDSYSWSKFRETYGPRFDMNAQLMAKIAGLQETQNISLFAEGGGPGAIYGQTWKVLCTNAAADPMPATVPVLSTFFIYPNGQFCPNLKRLRDWQKTFRRDVNEMASAIGSKRAVILEEIDSIGTSSCLKGKSLKLWLHDLSWESHVFGQLPHAVVYQEAGYSDAQGPAWTAKRLWKAGVNQVEGFYTNGTHFAWSSDEIKWAEKISDKLDRMSHHHYRAHFVINTAQNGHGPLLNPHPVQQGIENLCNPPGRGLGRMPTGIVNPTFDGHSFNNLDGFLWTGVPGRSHNSNCPNGPWKPAGVFDPRFALELAQNASEQLGPSYPSAPY